MKARVTERGQVILEAETEAEKFMMWRWNETESPRIDGVTTTTLSFSDQHEVSMSISFFPEKKGDSQRGGEAT
jgi:hypothetical protein